MQKLTPFSDRASTMPQEPISGQGGKRLSSDLKGGETKNKSLDMYLMGYNLSTCSEPTLMS
jgi:hypothetical protein